MHLAGMGARGVDDAIDIVGLGELVENVADIAINNVLLVLEDCFVGVVLFAFAEVALSNDGVGVHGINYVLE